MGCGCGQTTQQSINVNNFVQQSVEYDNTGCGVTREAIEQVKQDLLNKKTPENGGYINSKIGQLDTMLNLGKYCIYNIFEMMI